MIIRTSAPTRIDLAGGTIDIWPLYLFHPGAQTLNAAISLRASAQIEPRSDARITIKSLDTGATVDAAALVKAGVLRRAKDGVRLLGMGELKAKIAFSVWGASKSAVAAVEKAGGTVTILAPKREVAEEASA